MSIEYVRAVYELKQKLGPTKRALLAALAEHADRSGHTWPGNACLARETEISERQIQRLIPELETAGLLITVRPGNGKGHPRLIRLLFPPATIQRVTTDDQRVTTDDQRVTNDGAKGDNSCHPSDIPSDDQRVTTDDQRVTNDGAKGDMAPEVAAINPNYNPNNNPTAGGEDLDPVIAAPAPGALVKTAPTPPAPVTERVKAKPPRAPKLQPPTRPKLPVNGPYLDPRRFKNGYIPAGQGRNPVEVWYESFSIRETRWRLSAPMEDDLAAHCPDLDRLRPVCQEYRRHGHYAPGNLKLVFDWYDHGIPNRGLRQAQATITERKQKENDYDFSGYQPQLIVNGTAA